MSQKNIHIKRFLRDFEEIVADTSCQIISICSAWIICVNEHLDNIFLENNKLTFEKKKRSKIYQKNIQIKRFLRNLHQANGEERFASFIDLPDLCMCVCVCLRA